MITCLPAPGWQAPRKQVLRLACSLPCALPCAQNRASCLALLHKNLITICGLKDPTGASGTPRDWVLAVLINGAGVSRLQTQPSLLCSAGDGALQTSFLLCQQLCGSAKMESLREAARLEEGEGPCSCLPASHAYQLNPATVLHGSGFQQQLIPVCFSPPPQRSQKQQPVSDPSFEV